MRIGSDARHAPWPAGLAAPDQVDLAAEHGLEGLFFRTMLDMTPTLDRGILREVRDRIDAHGMYLESGLGKVNPYALAETPEVRVLGDGDTVLGFRKMMEAAAEIGIAELWVSTGGYKPYAGRFAYDRFRTDVDWADQLAAVEKFCHRLAPIARDLGLHLNPETHEEITSFELVRLVEAVGTDVMGITYDTANPLQRAEHPQHVAERVAPYVRQTHIKDTALFFDPDGIRRQWRPVGRGVVDMRAILSILRAANPALHLSLETAEPSAGPTPAHLRLRTQIALYDPAWVAGHPDLTVLELAEYLALVQRFADRVGRGEEASYDAFDGHPVDAAEAWEFVHDSARHVRSIVAELEASDGSRT